MSIEICCMYSPVRGSSNSYVYCIVYVSSTIYCNTYVEQDCFRDDRVKKSKLHKKYSIGGAWMIDLE